MTETQEHTSEKSAGDSLCEICHKVPFKYKCPGCARRTCSLACSKQHKITFDCSGKAYDPLKYVSHKEIQNADDEKHESNHLIQRDFNFLTGMKRKLKLDQHDAFVRNKKVLRSGFSTFLKDPPPSNSHCVMNRGAYCFLLPKKMSRSVNNRSRMDKREGVYTWTVEWLLCPSGGESVSHITHGFKETDTLAQGMTEPTFELCRSTLGISEETSDISKREGILRQHNVRFYIKWFPHGMHQYRESRELIELNTEKCLGELLRGRTVLEYPTVYVATNEADLPEGMVVIDETTKTDEERGLKSRYEGSTKSSNAPKNEDQASASDDEAPEVASTKDDNVEVAADTTAATKAPIAEEDDEYDPLA